VTELDLTAIRERAELAAAALSSITFATQQRATQVMDSACDVADLVAEVERLTRLLGPPELPSVDSYESMAQALADERAEVVRHCDRIATLTDLLAEILLYFPGPFRDTVVGVRSTFVPAETLDRWRSHLERAS